VKRKHSKKTLELKDLQIYGKEKDELEAKQ
jgi:hypothetical protein